MLHVLDGLLHIKGYYADRKGERDEMQDEHVIMDDVTDLFSNSCSEMYLAENSPPKS